jgi:hypothetical protein
MMVARAAGNSASDVLAGGLAFGNVGTASLHRFSTARALARWVASRKGEDGNGGCGSEEKAGEHVDGVMDAEVDAGEGDEDARE